MKTDPDFESKRTITRENLADSQFKWSYFQQLVGQYNTLPSPPLNPKVDEEAKQLVEVKRNDLTWDDVYRLESALLKLQPLNALRQRAWPLREEYREVASASSYAAYQASKPPNPETASEAELRADLENLQDELHWLYTVVWVQEDLRSEVAKKVTWAGVIWVGVGSLCLFFLWRSRDSWPDANLFLTYCIVIFAGVLGGYTSTLRRIQSTVLDGNSDLNLLELERGRRSVIISPYFGAVFSVVLYYIFLAGYLRGDLFPDLRTANNALLWDVGGDQAAIGAKLVVWSFIAGFAEQFVPDTLDKMTRKTSGSRKKKRVK